MPSRPSIRRFRRANSGTWIATVLLILGLTFPVTAAPNPSKHVILPDSRLIGCKASSCSQVMPDPIADSHAVYPWQVSVDITDGKIIGLIARYDPITPIDVIKAAIDERYGKWALPGLDTGPARIWRVEPEKFVIQLGKGDNGMIQVIYLALGAKHPASVGAPCVQYLGRTFQQNPCAAGPETGKHNP